MGALAALAVLSLAAWLYLVFLRGGFWRADQRLAPAPPPGAGWPAVAALVPARNEAPLIGRTLGALLAEDYAGAFAVVLIDDASSDGTADAVRAVAGNDGRLVVVPAASPGAGWTGKLWALALGVERAAEVLPEARYLWFSDADIEHDPEVLRELVARAEADRLDQVSLMALLRCRAPWERLLVPAFVFFFQKLYPFPWVNDPARAIAAAAGGCLLLRRDALAAAGGLDAVGGALIDDCALARAIKHSGSTSGSPGGAMGPRGAIWLGLTTATRSVRPYAGLAGIWRMVARSAFTQLRHSALLLVAAVFGMVVVYLGPPVALIGGAAVGGWPGALLGAAAWLLMAAAYGPTLRLYGQSAVGALLLPVAAVLYTLMMVDSAVRHWRGHGGAWKGRVQGVAKSG